MMKALFIIHCQDPIYGASRSVGNLIRNLDADVDILFPVKIKRDGITREQIQKFYGPRVRHIGYLPQPARLTALEGRLAFTHTVKSFVKDILYGLAQPIYAMIYRKGHYDYIHLNSVTLYPMLKKRWPMFLHVRESIRKQPNFWNWHLAQYLQRAHGLLYISQEIKDACPRTDAPGLVLVNPYNQTGVDAVDLQQTRKRFGLNGTETIYAMIGNITPGKGVDFVIQAFGAAKLENAVLLVAGADTNHEGYERNVIAMAQETPCVRYLGEIQDIEAVYRVTDYVVRGDSVVGAGRTVFESLYSGGGAILMGSREQNLTTLRLPSELEQRVYFYPIRDPDALAAVFQQTQHKRLEQRTVRTNVPEYVTQFNAFVQENRQRDMVE